VYIKFNALDGNQCSGHVAVHNNLVNVSNFLYINVEILHIEKYFIFASNKILNAMFDTLFSSRVWTISCG